VGAWPYDDPTPYGGIWKNFANHSSLGLALRNAPRVEPIIVLGFAGLLAAAVGSLTRPRFEKAAAVVVAALAVVALWPVWFIGYLSPGVARPEKIPSYWVRAAAAMQRDGNSTRVLEIPGAPFSAYRWGNTIEPVTPGLIDRPYLAREVLPYGAPQTVNLLDALDRRMQEGTFEPSSLAPVGRLLGIGTISLRSDLQYERFLTPRPRLLWAQLTAPLAPGLRSPVGFGPRVPNTPFPGFPLLDELDLRTPAAGPDPPPVALFDVKNAVPLVHTAPVARPVVLDGDGDGLVDAAAAGLLDGHSLVRELGAMDDGQLRQALQAGGDLVMTDSNRRRIQEWFTSLRDNKGATERAGQTSPDKSGYDFRLDPFPGEHDDGRTVVEQDGGRVDASADGGPGRPEDRPVRAFDGDLRTSWRVGGADPTGERLVLRPDRVVHADRVTLVQPQDGPRDRVLTKVRLRFDRGAPVVVDLGAASLTRQGQVIRFPGRAVRRLEIDLMATSTPSFDPKLANAVGFAEVHLGNVRVTETVRLPIDLSRRVERAARGHGIDVVLSRLRYEPGDRGRQDIELGLERRFVLPGARSFELSGTTRVNPNAPDRALDSVLGTTDPGVVFSASSHLAGDLDARASRAFDGDPATAWSPSIGTQNGQWLDVRLARNVTIDHLDLSVLADGRHSVPTRLRLEADGKMVRTLAVPAIADTVGVSDPHRVVLRFAPVAGRHLRLVIEAVRQVTPIPGDTRPNQALPVGIIEAGLAGVAKPASPVNVVGRCRNDLVRVDGRAVAVRVTGRRADARRGLGLSACAGPIHLATGSSRVQSQPGLDSGIDVDRVVLSSGRDGRPTAVGARGAALDTAGASTRVTRSDATSARLTVHTDGKPFWVVFGQSHSTGWKVSTAKGTIGPLQLVDGYANGWLVRPSGAGTMTINVDWTPQRLVWVGLAASVVAVLICVAIVAMTSFGLRRRTAEPGAHAGLADWPVLASPLAYSVGPPPSWAMTATVALATTLGTIALSRPWIGLVAGAATVLASRISRTRILLTLAIPLVLAFSRLGPTPELGWLALALLTADLACGWLRTRAAGRAAPSP
ncbi:MAG: alpha-(1-_3)-arabinofuranosyltransferase, partial [Actinomycetota bacterium]|nr:alpha-(1->3)-arabinofuranosyltransferase [Actinomycetota bacterium]